MQFQIVIPEVPNWPHGRMYKETAETLAFACRRLGHQAVIATNAFSPAAINVLLGSHDLPDAIQFSLPRQVILYNLEQIDDQFIAKHPHFMPLLCRHEVWDYSLQNIERLRPHTSRIHWLPVGTEVEMSRIPAIGRQDIDVLFYGTLNERRRVILERIKKKGIKLEYLFGVYGAERDACIQRSKIVLNLHHHEAKVFEIVRVSYLLANKKAVVSELYPFTDIEPELREAVLGASADDIPAACSRLLSDRKQRRQLERRGYEIMAARKQSEFLARVLAERSEQG